MAIKIETPPEPRKTTCKSCGARLTYEFEDIQESSGYSYGDYVISYFIKCPQKNCGATCYVSKELKER